jgi:hypothetical protein
MSALNRRSILAGAAAAPIAALAGDAIAVNRLPNLPPHRRPILTPCGDEF